MSPEVSAIVVAYDRLEATLTTLERLQQCQPPPTEILVHVDGNQEALSTAIREHFPDTIVYCNPENVGPGGGRNWLLQHAKGPIIASFDDDSFPKDDDYFQRLCQLADEHPEAVIFAAQVEERSQDSRANDETKWVADFIGCGCAYRSDFFRSTSGYVPMPIAYGMEEADLALRVHSKGGRVLYSPNLRVYHNTSLDHHQTPRIAAKQLANAALLPFLRYPLYLFPVGFLQFSKKLLDTLKRGRFFGAALGLTTVIPHLFCYRQWREPLSGKAVLSFLTLRRHPHLVDHANQ